MVRYERFSPLTHFATVSLTLQPRHQPPLEPNGRQKPARRVSPGITPANKSAWRERVRGASAPFGGATPQRPRPPHPDGQPTARALHPLLTGRISHSSTVRVGERGIIHVDLAVLCSGWEHAKPRRPNHRSQASERILHSANSHHPKRLATRGAPRPGRRFVSAHPKQKIERAGELPSSGGRGTPQRKERPRARSLTTEKFATGGGNTRLKREPDCPDPSGQSGQRTALIDLWKPLRINGLRNLTHPTQSTPFFTNRTAQRPSRQSNDARSAPASPACPSGITTRTITACMPFGRF